MSLEFAVIAPNLPIRMTIPGATAYRNARDWAEEQRNGTIDLANRAIATIPGQTISNNASITSTGMDNETSEVDFTEGISSPENIRYTNPPNADRTSDTALETELNNTSRTASSVDVSKRTNQHIPGSSPAQKRSRVQNPYHSPSLNSNTTPVGISTGLSFQYGGHRLDQGEDDLTTSLK
ncbi:hypothetical protein H2198_002066 [Neophaeococcomyces mojaviensis]|uniref:Uncharacterized protein n=1 Tax=Neophaeococcomyces mojaviensis TaxID=3383035 RepID=A0ACC3AFG2_9EURO|nr:hypothetical protein H2198_002066 [Knufia sp. JES_112]